MNRKVPFNRPYLVGAEIGYIREAVSRGHISGDGIFTERVQRYLEDELGVAKALLTPSGTHALELAALLLDLQPGDEVVLPSFTFVSTANAFVLRGARPVFVDIRPDTLNLDETKLADAITPRTRAIVAVHYAGVGCEMNVIRAEAEARGVPIIEDAAHALFGRYRGLWLGAFGSLAALSFHETKNFTCGEGGALLINRPEHIARAEILREKGTDRSAFLRGEIDKYTWVDLGSSYLPSDLQAAFLYGQLEARVRIQERRKAVWDYYLDKLSLWAQENAVQLPTVPTHCDHPSHLFYLILPTTRDRDDFIEHLRREGIQSVFHYVPLHLSKMGRRFGGEKGAFPVCESIASRLVRLPFFTGLNEEEQSRVVNAVAGFRPGATLR